MDQDTEFCAFSINDWDEYARCYDTLLELGPYRSLCEAVSHSLRPSKGDRILDAGCGTGNLLSLLSQRDTGALFCGIDLSTSMLARAYKKLAQESAITLLRSSLDDELPFPDESFTKVVSMNVLYALPHPEYTLRELYRVLTHGGALVLATPKQGYDNGLILKEHTGSSLPDSFWRDAHSSPEREALLVREATADEGLISALLTIARFNRVIARTAAFHFFTKEEMHSLVKCAGFTDAHITPAYAGQAHLVTARKE